MRQFEVDDFVYQQKHPNDTLDTSTSCTILHLKTIRTSGVLELQGTGKRISTKHSKNYASWHSPNLNPTIVTYTCISPLDHACQVCESIDDVDQMLLCDNCKADYQMFCLTLELTQVPSGF
ncbi:hypothetical protein MPTK1_1g03880 [Marchantia polymorpha subsp. ruderalis]|uniref:PHD-type domain-containing protein n=2 Tax=Marchantia polymorpha TaxID=3197 RepID=A0AAF6AL92_MARPO|nr:hypothetical protein MARPO_0005s0219 [Marchantia polymorpha]BBM97212.1 hypothetical protein Mp_1g03880 [Marchantia polymorpha subsp. ruderalis]|eukprot:PTQ48596.1 hypothetical protein MARPO_0005s0219 [Marchantia polymorpha]